MARSGGLTLVRLVLFAAVFVLLAGVASIAAAPLAAGAAGMLPGELGSIFWDGAATLVAALLAGLLVRRWLGGADPWLGFRRIRRAARDLALGLAIGAGSLSVVAVVLVLSGWLAYVPQAGSAAGLVVALAAALVGLAPAAAAEEALFRGYPFQALEAATGGVVATLALSGLFAAAHLGNPSVGAIGLGNIFLAGVMLSAAFLRTRSLWFASAVHLGWNWAMGGLFDLPVSGLLLVDTPLYEPVERGPDWVTGGEFGIEGGVAATAAFGLALGAVLVLTSGKRSGGGSRQTRGER